jgi:hypothetical protein
VSPCNCHADRVVVHIAGDAAHDTFFEVGWEGKTVAIFAIDLRTRGEFVRATSAARDSC